ncbi:MAG: complex I subunit 5 family protein [Lachnospiraceae bacterium]|nr:complex I subunit 5 family protein [Lachnospiraceae bacterium]
MTAAIQGICGQGLNFTMDGFRAVYVVIACFMWAMTALFSPEYFRHYTNKARYYVFFIMTLLSLIGVFLSADLFTTFLFFELMSFTSYVWVAQDERPASLRAAATYLAIAVIGGLTMLLGIMMLYVNEAAGTEVYGRYPVCGLIFIGFAAKAGVYPLHIWLPKAHPVAPAPASALLSGILTKSGIFGILILSFRMMEGDLPWGWAMLVLGLVTMVLGAVLAIFSIDLKRTLACSSMSQIGFIMTGIGMGTMEGTGHEGALAHAGTFLHMVNHSVFKLVLFLVAGVVYMNLHELDLNRIRGFGRKKPFIKVIFAIGALGIGGIPLFSGYVSKTMLHEGILEGASFLGGYVHAVEWIFLFSGGCTVAYMLKLFAAIFLEKNADEKRQEEFDERTSYISPLSAAALTLSAIPVAVLGLFPHQTMERIAALGAEFLNTHEPEAVHYFNLENLKGGLISVTIGVLIYFFVIRKLLMRNGEYADLWWKKLDLEDMLYRPLLLTVIPFIGTFFARIADGAADTLILFLRKTVYSDRRVPREFAEGNAATHFLGDLLDRRYRLLRGEDLPPTETYEHRVAIRYYKFAENRNIISRSLSFGLALASLGLLFTLGYLLRYLLL